MSVRFPKKVVVNYNHPLPVAPVVAEFVIQESERTGETSEELQEWLAYESDKRGVTVEEIVKEESDALQWTEEHPLTKEQLDRLVELDQSLFDSEENPFE